MISQAIKLPGRRSDCPISCSLEIFGDKWSLLIIRDMMFAEKSTYNEFLASEEKIATNILNDRLHKLTDMGVITFTGAAKRKKYELTETGKGLKPILAAIGIFGLKHVEGTNITVSTKTK